MKGLRTDAREVFLNNHINVTKYAVGAMGRAYLHLTYDTKRSWISIFSVVAKLFPGASTTLNHPGRACFRLNPGTSWK